MSTLTLVDVLRIQAFVFATNRLKDVVQGSLLVTEATSPELLTGLGYAPTLIYAAGGNALLEFDTHAQAHRWAAAYSRVLIDGRRDAAATSALLEDGCPGLDVEIVHAEVEGSHWTDRFQAAQTAMRQRKLSRRADARMTGLGVTAECAETRGVATHVVNEPGRGETAVSVGVAVRRDHAGSESRWLEMLPSDLNTRLPRWALEFTRNNDELGRTSGDTSLVGIVHIDGNQVGHRISQTLKRWADEGSTTDQLKERQKQLSMEIDTIGRNAMRGLFERVVGALREEEDRLKLHSKTTGMAFSLGLRGERTAIFPIRPVLLGGDEMTFICDGRIALDAARSVLEYYRDNKVPLLGGGSLGACAGVAIVKAHAPFARAYALAESLCRSAKVKARREADEKNQPDTYALDWLIGYSTPLESLESLRARQYGSRGQTLHMRPYLLGDPTTRHTFAWLDDTVLGGKAATGPHDSREGFQQTFWQQRRNKVKELRRVVRLGPDALNAALKAWEVTADVQGLPAGTAAFDGSQSWLLDAIELLDLHHPLR